MLVLRCQTPASARSNGVLDALENPGSCAAAKNLHVAGAMNDSPSFGGIMAT